MVYCGYYQLRSRRERGNEMTIPRRPSLTLPSPFSASTSSYYYESTSTDPNTLLTLHGDGNGSKGAEVVKLSCDKNSNDFRVLLSSLHLYKNSSNKGRHTWQNWQVQKARRRKTTIHLPYSFPFFFFAFPGSFPPIILLAGTGREREREREKEGKVERLEENLLNWVHLGKSKV